MAYNSSATNLHRHRFSNHDIIGAVYHSQLAQITKESSQTADSSAILPQAVIDDVINCIF